MPIIEPSPVGAASATSGHLVITVHGIRTFGKWQERLERMLRFSRSQYHGL